LYLIESPALLVAIAFGPLTCAFHPSRFRIAAVAWMAADFLMVAMQNKGLYVHNYLIQFFPSLFFAATLGAAVLFQTQARERWTVSVLRLAGAATVIALCWLPLKAAYAARQPTVHKQWQILQAGPSAWQANPAGIYEQQIGEYIRGHSDADDTILVCGQGLIVGASVSLYWTSDRAPASRYFYPHMLTGFRVSEHLALLERNRPRYVIVTDCTNYIDKIQPWLHDNYVLETTITQSYPVQIWTRLANPVGPAAVAVAEGGMQLLEGVGEGLSGPHASQSYADYRGGGRSTWTYVEDMDHEVTWNSPPVPERLPTLLALTATESPETAEAELYVNGRSVLEFPIGGPSGGRGRWEANGYAVAFMPKGDFMGNSGVFLIGIPPEAVTPGEALRLRVALTGGTPRAWFMVKDYRDTVDFEGLSPRAVDYVLHGEDAPAAAAKADN
jgi:hypothetical protein